MSDTPRVVKTLLNASGGSTHTTVAAGQWVEIPKSEKVNLEAWLSSAGGTATVEIHGSNFGGVPGTGSLLATFILSGADDRGSQQKPDPAYLYMCAKITAISGATVTAVVGG